MGRSLCFPFFISFSKAFIEIQFMQEKRIFPIFPSRFFGWPKIKLT